MPLLPLPPGGSQLGGGDLPVVSTDDVLAILPAYLKPGDSAPVRDGLIAALTAMLLTYQERSAYGAAQSDVLRATDSYLQGLGGDRGALKQATEGDEDFRARVLATPNLVTPTAILAAVNAILAPLTSIKAQYFESVADRHYVRAAPAQNDSVWHSFVYKSTTNSRSPYYPDRLYEDDAAKNNGYTRPQSNPGGARVFRDTVGRFFVLRVPDLGVIDAEFQSVYQAASPGAPNGQFVYSSAPGTVGAFVRKDSASSIDTYRAIANTVERIHAGSIRWSMLVEPQLNL